MTTDHKAQVEAAREECHRLAREVYLLGRGSLGALKTTIDRLAALASPAPAASKPVGHHMPSEPAQEPIYLIFFDDHDVRPEILTSEAAARERFRRVSDSWNAHLFVKVQSNTRDDPSYGRNAAPQPPAASEPVAYKSLTRRPNNIMTTDHKAQVEAARELDEMLLRELSAIQKIALAGEAGEVVAGSGFNEIAQRLGYVARSVHAYLVRIAALASPAPAPEKIAPVQGWPAGIPWSLHLEAYAAYCKRWSPQPSLIDLEGHNCRGGFTTGELDEFIPGWRDRASEITALKAEIAKLKTRVLCAGLDPWPNPGDPVIEDALRAPDDEHATPLEPWSMGRGASAL